MKKICDKCGRDIFIWVDKRGKHIDCPRCGDKVSKILKSFK